MEALLSNSTRKLLWFEISKMLTAVLKKLIVITHWHGHGSARVL